MPMGTFTSTTQRAQNDVHMVIQHGEGIFMKNTEETKKQVLENYSHPKLLQLAVRCLNWQ